MNKPNEKVEKDEVRCPQCRGRGYTGTLTDATYTVCPKCDGRRYILVVIHRPEVPED